jgi:hypothetical protein
MKSLTAGFDAITNHLDLIFFSISLDIALWLGPHLRLGRIFKAALDQMSELSRVDSTGLFNELQTFSQNLNLLSVLRTFPVGVPSLLASRVSVDTPVGTPLAWEIPSAGIGLAIWLGLTVAGMAAGTLYFSLVAQAAVTGKTIWRNALDFWPRASLNVALLALAWFFMITAALLPFSCIILFVLSGIGLGEIGFLVLLVLGGVLIWLLIPLLFSSHGIFVNQNGVWVSVLRSINITRMTLPSTSLLFLVLLVLSEGLDVLWNIPPSNSWLLIVGIIGHAFVTSSLLAASFVYYRDADIWVQEVVKQIKLSSA